VSIIRRTGTSRVPKTDREPSAKDLVNAICDLPAVDPAGVARHLMQLRMYGFDVTDPDIIRCAIAAADADQASAWKSRSPATSPPCAPTSTRHLDLRSKHGWTTSSHCR
jgi:hypothetical protein